MPRLDGVLRDFCTAISGSPDQEKSKRDGAAGQPASAAFVPHDPGRRCIALFGPLVPRDDGQRDYKFILDQHRRHEPIFVQNHRLIALRHLLLERRALEQRHLDLVRDVTLERSQTALAQEVYPGLVLELDDQPAARILAKRERGRDDSRIRLQHLGETVEAFQLDLAAENAASLPEGRKLSRTVPTVEGRGHNRGIIETRVYAVKTAS